MKRIFPIVALVAIALVGVLWYSHRARQRALESGAVYVRDQSPAAPANAAPQSPEQTETAAAYPPTSPATASTAMTQPHGAIAVPAADTISRNPPGNLVFAGAGKYQLYRQGDITWRLNTDTGQACILFATDVQWSRPRVYTHGCGAS